MMDTSFQKTYEEQLLLLPEINRKAIASLDWMSKVIEVGKRRGLHIDQIDDLRIEVMLVLVGAVPASEFQNTIMVELALSPTEAGKITTDINTTIFDPIHDFIIKNSASMSEATAAPSAPAQQPIVAQPAAPTPVVETQPIPQSPLEQAGISIEPVPAPAAKKEESLVESAHVLEKTGIAPITEEPLPAPTEKISRKAVGVSLESILQTGDPAVPPEIHRAVPFSRPSSQSLSDIPQSTQPGHAPLPRTGTTTRHDAAIEKLKNILARNSLSQPDHSV